MTHLAPAFTRTKYDEAATLQYDQTSQSPFEWITANLRPGECFQAQSPLLSSTLGMSPESVNNETEIQAVRNHSLSKTMILSNPVHSYNPSAGCGTRGLFVPQYTRDKKPCLVTSYSPRPEYIDSKIQSTTALGPVFGVSTRTAFKDAWAAKNRATR